MAATDKDIHQKLKAIRFCLATDLIPFLEVNVTNVRELSDTPQILTDIDVLGITISRSGIKRTIFDCKTVNTSPINRAFWAAGVMNYVGSEEAFVILRKAAPEAHKMSAKSLGVHLFDETLFEHYATARALTYTDHTSYVADIDNWHRFHTALRSHPKIIKVTEYLHHFVPLEDDFARSLRGIISHFKQVRGELDPARREHMAVYCYGVFALALVLAQIVMDFFDAFDPKHSKSVFEEFLRTYIWGGRESYQLRRKLRELMATQNQHISADVELSAWSEFLELVRTLLDAPSDVQSCCNPLLELSLRYVATRSSPSDLAVANRLVRTNRIRQFIFRMSAYLISACGIAKDFDEQLRADINLVIEELKGP